MFLLIPESVQRNPWIQTLLVLFAVAGVVGFCFWIRDILLPFFIAFIVAYMLDPVVDWIEENMRLNRTLSILLIIILVSIFIGLFGWYLTAKSVDFIEELSNLADNPPDLLNWIENWAPVTVQNYIEGYSSNFNSQKLLGNILQFMRDNLAGVVDTLSEGSTYFWLFASRTLGALGFLVNLSIVLIVSIYLLRDFDNLVEYCYELIPHRYRRTAQKLFGEIDELLRAFFRGHLIVCLTIGALYGLGYQAVGLSGGFLVGFLSGLMNVVPYLGPAVGFTLALGMAFYQFNLAWQVVGIIVVYGVVQALEGNILTPKIVGDAVGLNPVIVIFALMVFGKILGFLGLLLAIPLAAIIKVIAGHLLKQYRETEYFQSVDSQ
ncbi:MAG: AI-2E family transporter [bacterium]